MLISAVTRSQVSHSGRDGRDLSSGLSSRFMFDVKVMPRC
jgi:hypothetical protein